jgi:hypothetical protein
MKPERLGFGVARMTHRCSAASGIGGRKRTPAARNKPFFPSIPPTRRTDKSLPYLEMLYIAPGANGYAESFNSKVRDGLLNAEEFGSVLEARVLANAWKRVYNHVRPHSSLGYRTPAEVGAMVPRADSAALRRPEEPSVTVDPTPLGPCQVGAPIQFSQAFQRPLVKSILIKLFP